MTPATDKIIIYTDGGSRGNPGPAAAGFVITDEHKNEILASGIYLGETTNNVAEYTAVIEALQAAERIHAKTVSLFSDSELVVKQINGLYKVRSSSLAKLYAHVCRLIADFRRCDISHVRREKNTLADELVNIALDRRSDFQRSGEPAQTRKVRMAVLISGGGTTLMNLVEKINRSELTAEIPLVISSGSTVPGVKKAEKAGLHVEIIRRKDSPDIEEFSRRLTRRLIEAKVELVVQAGWLCLWKIPKEFENRVMNIHPALLPGFGGKGMYGKNVHQAVLEAGCKVSGCTVHFCNNQYDAGPVIIQRCCPVEENDTPESLAKRVFREECIAYPEAIRLFARDKLDVLGRRVKIRK